MKLYHLILEATSDTPMGIINIFSLYQLYLHYSSEMIFYSGYLFSWQKYKHVSYLRYRDVRSLFVDKGMFSTMGILSYFTFMTAFLFAHLFSLNHWCESLHQQCFLYTRCVIHATLYSFDIPTFFSNINGMIEMEMFHF